MAAKLTGAQLVADLEEVRDAEGQPIDPNVIRMVRLGLGAIAAHIRDLDDPKARLLDQAAAVVDPEPGR